jgi:hypothetical protein
MTIASDIIGHRMPNFEAYVRAGENLDNIDEYGFTPLIECAITRQPNIAEQLLALKVDVNKPDVTGRTALHWAVDNADMDLVRLLLDNGANPNAYTRNGLSILVFPVLRGETNLKQLLYQHGAKLDFALDFINGKLIGHRYELKGYVDILTAEGEFTELDYEGFILEFTVAVVKDALRRFISSYSTRHLRKYFPHIHVIMDAFNEASELLQFQHYPTLTDVHLKRLGELIKAPMLILPAASSGHAFCFIKYKKWWAKIDRGENSLTEGTVNIYEITHPEQISVSFLQEFLFKKQRRSFFHKDINRILGLVPVDKMPIAAQVVGNCSWANVQSIVPVAYALLELENNGILDSQTAIDLYDQWVEWDKDRALDEAIQHFYLASRERKASIASMLGSVLFNTCDFENKHHLERAEKIVKILTLPEYYFILKSYLDEYCVKRLTIKGNNLLKVLDDCGVNPNIGVTPIATGL